jgi:hypothetical protein
VLTVQRGPDFDVARVRPLVEFPDTPPLLGMALTDHPQPASDEPTKSRAATLLGAAIEW